MYFVCLDLLPMVRTAPTPPELASRSDDLREQPAPFLPASPPGNPRMPDYPDLQNFMIVAHCLWALLLAWLGAQLARWFYATQERSAITRQ